MKKRLLITTVALLLQNFLILVYSKFNGFDIAAQEPLFPLLIIPIIIVSVLMLCLLIITIARNQRSRSLLHHVFEHNLTLTISILVAFMLLASSAWFFILADSFLPEIYKSLLPFGLLAYALGWEVLVLLSFEHKRLKNNPKYWIGLPFLIAANYFLWHDLVIAGRYLDEFLPNVYPGKAEFVLANYRWWQLLLPIREFQGMWQFELILVYVLENLIGISGLWYLFQAILILVAFFLSWKVFKSKIVSYMLPFLLVFGTHFYHAFQYSSLTAFYLLYTSLLLFMYCSHVYIRKGVIAFFLVAIPTFLFIAIMYEGSLDFFAAMWLTAILLFFYFKRIEKKDYRRRVSHLFIVINIVFILYMLVKFTYIPFPHTSGESAVAFSYPPGNFWRIVEDLVSNYFKNLYMTLTNFLPPELMISNALYQYEDLQQHSNPFVVGNYLFYWRYFAGAYLALFYVLFSRVMKKIWNEKEISEFFPLGIFMIMIAVNGATHTLLKFRPPRIVPLPVYHVFQGVLGLSFCISYGLDVFYKKAKNRKIANVVLSLVVLTVLYGVIRRPNYLWHMAEMIGIDHQGPYPNPLAVLIIKIRRMIPGFLL